MEATPISGGGTSRFSGSKVRTIALLSLIFLLASLSLFVKTTLKKTQIGSKAGSDTVNLILKLVKDPATGEISIEKASANNGYTVFQPETFPHPALNVLYTHHLEQVVGGEVVASAKFLFQAFYPQFGGPPYILEKPEAWINISYRKNAQLKVKNLADRQLTTLPLVKVAAAVASMKMFTVFPQPVRLIANPDANQAAPPRQEAPLGNNNWRETPPVINGIDNVCMGNEFYSYNYNQMDDISYYAPPRKVPGSLELERCRGSGCANFSVVATKRYITTANPPEEKSSSMSDDQIGYSAIYRYRVRLHANDGIYGPYSNIVEITTCDHPNPTPTPPAANDGRLKILVMGDDFPDESSFYGQAQALVNQLTAVPLFTRNVSKTDFLAYYTSVDLGCHHPDDEAPALVLCDSDAVYGQAAGVYHDKIVVLYNNGNFLGTAIGYGGDTYAVVSTGTGDNLGVATAHELGHALGGLGDEYIIEGIPFEAAISNINCDEDNCQKWAGVPGTSCIQGCVHLSAYRSAEHTVMKADSNDFGSLDDAIMQAAIDGYAAGGGEGGNLPPPEEGHGCGCGASCAAGARCAFDTGLGCDPGFDCVPGGAEGFQCYSPQYCSQGQDNCPRNLRAVFTDSGDLNISWNPVLAWSLRYRLTVKDETVSQIIYNTPNSPCVDDGNANTDKDPYDCDGQYACPVPNRNSPPPGNNCISNQEVFRGLPATSSNWTIPSSWLTAGHSYKISLDGGEGPEGILPNCAPLEVLVQSPICSAKINCSSQYKGYRYSYIPVNYPACTIGTNPPDGGWPNWPADYTCRPDICTGVCTNTVSGCSSQYSGYRYSFTPTNYPDCVVGNAPNCGGASWPVWSGEDPACNFGNQNQDDYTRDLTCGATACVTPTSTPTPPIHKEDN